MLSPYNLGSFLVAEDCSKIKVNDLVTNAMKALKIRLVQSQIDALGVEVKLTSSSTKFNGKRLWFVCPNCTRRIGTIYKHPTEEIFGCRICLNLKYRKQRFKGMIESAQY